MRTLFSLKRLCRSARQVLAPAVIMWLTLGINSAFAHWPNTNATKFVQMPDLSTNGMDIYFGNYPTILADDFVCTNTGPITDIHLWVSSIENVPTTGAQFELSIWSDVPAGPTGPSHPGQLLWSQVFGPGQYEIALYATNLQEQFWNLDPVQFFGPDNKLFQYNFYPPDPFIQTGTPNAPVIYWLGVSMLNNNPPQGWKTSREGLAPDYAVLGHYPAGGGTNVTDWRTLFDPRAQTNGLNFSFALTTRQPTNPPPTCPETNGVKWVQWPHLDGGMDVLASHEVALAEDFLCTNTGPITDIHVWGSWLQNAVDTNITFWLGIYTDVPAMTNGTVVTPSHPGSLVWQQYFGPGQYSQSLYGAGIEQFLDPRGPTILGPDTEAYYYCFFPTNPFVQQGSTAQPTVYWLSVYAQLQTPLLFGWKTSQNHFNDAPVWGVWPGGPPAGPWEPIKDPTGLRPSLAFKLTTVTNGPPPSPCCPETNGVKFVQPPNTINGLDVLASRDMLLADDFRCTNPGPVTDIHIWGSWKDDAVDTNTSFTLGIWSDIPAITNGPAPIYSRPGVLLWSQTFGPGEYIQCLFTNGTEAFYDPSIPAILGPDTQMYYLCFYPKEPFVQQGTTAQPTNYWVSINAQPSAAAGRSFGWKTSATKYNDDAVWFKGAGLPGPAAWNRLVDLQQNGLQLGFKITTVTNGCPPLSVICPTNKTVPCGTTWSFDLPIVTAPCCGTNFSMTATTVTNGNCPQVLTRTWQIVDCLARTAVCTQTVVVIDNTPPVMTCSNLTVQCGTGWTIVPPTAFDACCGTNVTVTAIKAVTNGVCPKLITITWDARDCCTNTASCDQVITVVDTTPPVITCPTNIVVSACTNTVVCYTATAIDSCDPNVTVAYSPPSCTLFGLGTTNTVTVTATDACGNTNTCTFTVAIVRPPLGTLTITHSGPMITITWVGGVLQSSTHITGPWSDVPAATSPYTTSIIGAHKFYRLRCGPP